MKVTTRIVTEVEPAIKTKLKEIADVTKGGNMTKVLVDLIEKEYKRVTKKANVEN